MRSIFVTQSAFAGASRTGREIACCSVVLIAAFALAGCPNRANSTDADVVGDAADGLDGDALPWPDTIDAATDVPPVDVPPPRWACPPEWVPFDRGGCGPAVILCAQGGGALAGACDGIDIHTPRTFDPGDGGAIPAFFVQSDGGLGGGWNGGAQPNPDAGAQCPAGLVALADGTCGAVIREDCPAGTGALPDGTCTATGDDRCPADAFADPGPEAMGATIVHVLASADPLLADGSATHPYASIASGVAHAGIGGWVLLGAGSYVEGVTLDHDVHVLGVCATRATVAAGGTTPTLHVVSHAHADVRGLTFSGATAAIILDTGAQLSLANSRIIDATGLGMAVSDPGTLVTARDVLVRGTLAVLGGPPGVGLRVRGGASFVGSRFAYESNQSGVVVGDAGSHAMLRIATLRDSQQRFDGTDAAGISALAGGTIDAQGVAVLASRGFGVLADQTGSSIALSDSVVRDSLPLSEAAPGVGVHARGGAHITLVRTTVSGNRAAGVWSAGIDSDVQITDSAVTDTLPNLAGIAGRGVEAGSGASMQAERVAIVGATEMGAFVNSGATGAFRDVIITSTQPSIRGFGLGVLVGVDARLDASRVAVTHVSGAGIAAANTGSALPGVGGTVTARHLFVQDVMEESVQLARTGPAMPLGPAVAYGLSSTGSSELHASFVVIADGMVGLFDRSSGLSLENGLVTGQETGVVLGSNAASSQPTFYDVTFLGNIADGPVVDTTTPEPFSSP